MAEYLFIYRSGADGTGDAPPSPEQMQQIMQQWMDWIQGGTEAGWMIDGGDALLPGGKVLAADGAVTDGPHPETKELVGGYSIIKAKDLNEALKYAKTCPHHAGAGDSGGVGGIEIRQLAKMA